MNFDGGTHCENRPVFSDGALGRTTRIQRISFGKIFFSRLIVNFYRFQMFILDTRNYQSDRNDQFVISVTSERIFKDFNNFPCKCTSLCASFYFFYFNPLTYNDV